MLYVYLYTFDIQTDIVIRVLSLYSDSLCIHIYLGVSSLQLHCLLPGSAQALILRQSARMPGGIDTWERQGDTASLQVDVHQLCPCTSLY